MKKGLIKFFNNPKQVTVVALLLAVFLGVYGYMRINRLPVYAYTVASSGVIEEANGSLSLRDLILGFVSSGRIASVNVKVGDKIKKDQVLATLDSGTSLGALSVARASYANAEANYQKVINGASGPAIDVAKAAVNTAKVNLALATTQQETLVSNAYRALLNSTIAAEADGTSSFTTAPSVSGTYTLKDQGVININVYQSGDGNYFTATGLVQATGKASTSVPQPIGNSGLYIVFPQGSNNSVNNWSITLPNTKAANYLSNYNAYQAALETKNQTISSLQAVLDQAQANLASVASSARPEDVAQAQAQVESAKGALEIAQASYSNTVITAPGDGTVTAVFVTPGQIAQANAQAIEILASTREKNVDVMIPSNSIFYKNGVPYVLKKTTNGIKEELVTLGVSDGKNTEIINGLVVGDQVVTR